MFSWKIINYVIQYQYQKETVKQTIFQGFSVTRAVMGGFLFGTENGRGGSHPVSFVWLQKYLEILFEILGCSIWWQQKYLKMCGNILLKYLVVAFGGSRLLQNLTSWTLGLAPLILC